MTTTPPSDSSPKTPNFDSLSFLIPSAMGAADSESDLSITGAMVDEGGSDPQCTGLVKSSSFQYDPGVIRRMKKSAKYTLNNDVFEQKSRPVSVASIADLTDGEGETKESRFNKLHKPVLFLKSCPSPHLHKQQGLLSPESLLGKLSLLDSIVQELYSRTCEQCGRRHHQTEHCLPESPVSGMEADSELLGMESSEQDLFSAQDTQVHCNPLFRDPTKTSPPPTGKKKKKKKRRKVFKFGDGMRKSHAATTDSDSN